MKNPTNIQNQAIKKREKFKFSVTWGKLLKYCKPFYFLAVLSIVFAIGGTVFTIIGPDKLKEITDLISSGLLTGIDLEAVANIGLTLIAFYSSSVILSYLQGFVVATVNQKISKKMRGDISKKINKLPLKYFDSNTFGDVLSRVTNDVDTISQALNQSMGTLVISLAQFIGAIIMMFVTNWIMALVAIASSLLGFVVMGLIVAKSQKHFVRQQLYLGEMNGHIEEVYSGHNVIKVYNAEEEFGKRFNKLNKNLYSCGWKSQFMSGLMMPLMSFIGNFSYVAVCVVGAVLTVKGIISFGVIVAFMIYIRLFTQPLSQFAQAMTSLQSAGAASFRVFQFLEEKELEDERNKKVLLNNVSGNIEFRNVKFGYSKDKVIINDFSVNVKAGQKVAIVGPTGAGKTTIVNLLMRFYEINDGEILIDGVSTKTLTRENVRDQFCMVLQDTWLFEGTIKENIKYNQKNVTQEEIINACKTVGIHHFIETLPNGYETILNEDASISSGQKQLITIARAMVDKSPMLILDEATSSVDTRTEVLIQKAMDKLLKKRTSIIIAHRLSTIKNADLILVMKDGDVIEKGTHKQLLRKKGYYFELYNSQFERENIMNE